MDDTAQNQKQETKSQPQIVPGGAMNKEAVSTYIQPSEQEPNLHPEVRNAGVEKVLKEPELTAEHEKIGISPSFPVPSTEPTGIVKLPTDSLTENEAKEIKKRGEGSDLEVKKHFEGIYEAPSILGLAIIKLKELSRKLLRRQI